MTGHNGSDLFFRILKIFKENPEKALNFTQISTALEAHRREVAGAFKILQELGIVNNVYSRRTAKLFMLKNPLPLKNITDKIQSIYKAVDEEVS
jgi:hypothetical protein